MTKSSTMFVLSGAICMLICWQNCTQGLSSQVADVQDSALQGVSSTPTAPTFSSVSSVSVTVNWTATANISWYEVLRAPNNNGSPGAFTELGSTSGTSYVDSTVVANTQYWYELYAFSSASSYTVSAAASVVTGSSQLNPTAPTAAQLAGFTTLAANYDFSQSTYSKQSNWYDCTGSLPNVPFHQGNPGVVLKNPCNINQIIDGLSTVMDFQYLTTYEANNYGGQFNQVGGQTWDIFQNAPGADYPNMYIESVARIARTFNQPANSGGPNDVWTWGDGQNSSLEIDVFELYEDQGGF